MLLRNVVSSSSFGEKNVCMCELCSEGVVEGGELRENIS